MIRTILIDDEQEGLDVLEYEINRLDIDIDIVGKFADPKIALTALQNDTPDVVFLDIEMPWMSAFELLDQLDEILFDVIFVTAHDQFALKAFRYYAIDYLLKPVDQASLKKAVSRVVEKRRGFSKEFLQDILLTINNRNEPLNKIALPTMEGYEFVSIPGIIRCEADNNYCKIYLDNGKKILASKTLKYIQGLLQDHNFFRTHHSHLINVDHIHKYVKSGGGYVIMSDNSIVNVSRAKKDEFMSILRSG